ncbi:MAG: aldo/keto reductase [Alphaproteobacteria bacterium]|nr:aldo/keto reductase [Alphaproteobacteria bacterium]
MHKRQLGRSGLETAAFSLGGNVFGWTADQETSFRLLDRCVEAGVSLIDTADVYSAWMPGHKGGESETVIGAWLKARGAAVRAKVLIATKVGMLAARQGLKKANIAAACDDSLRRLNIDVIDLYQAHRDDEETPLEETLGAFGDLIKAGKVRAIGASNYTAERLRAALDVSAKHALPRYETLQPLYNLSDRAGFEGALQDLCAKEGVGVIPFYGLASGFLTGKYRSEADFTKSIRGMRMGNYLNARGLKILGAMDEVAAATRATLAQVALAWLMTRKSIAAPIASATSVAQLEELLGALTLTLSAAQIAALDAASAAPPD